MREAEFKAWMEAEGYSPNTINTQMTDVRRLDKAYGNLDDLPVGESLTTIKESLTYSKADQRAGKPNPAKFPIDGNLYENLSHFRAALNFYQRFVAAQASTHGSAMRPNVCQSFCRSRRRGNLPLVRPVPGEARAPPAGPTKGLAAAEAR